MADATEVAPVTVSRLGPADASNARSLPTIGASDPAPRTVSSGLGSAGSSRGLNYWPKMTVA